jgi:hypothetical protein
MSVYSHDITHVAVLRHGVLHVTFADGLEGDVDVLQRMCGPVFAEARTAHGFLAVAVDPDLGTIAWPNGADLAPDTLHGRIRTGRWPEQDDAGVQQRLGNQ